MKSPFNQHMRTVVALIGLPAFIAFIMPILMDWIRPSDISAFIVYFLGGFHLCVPIAIGLAISLYSGWGIITQFVIGTAVGTIWAIANLVGCSLHEYVQNHAEHFWFIPGIMLCILLPTFVIRLIWNLRLSFANATGYESPTILDLMKLTALVGIGYSAFERGKLLYPTINELNQVALIFAGCTSVGSVLFLTIFMLPAINADSQQRSARNLCLAGLIMGGLALGITAIGMIMVDSRIDGEMMVATGWITCGFLSALFLTLFAIRRMGLKLITGRPDPPLRSERDDVA